VNEHAAKGPLSSAVHRVGAVTSHQVTAVGVAVLALGWVLVWLLSGRPQWMLQSLEAAAAVVTLVMVFVIHHEQHRVEAVTQLKLDEIVQALPGADDAIVKAEAGTDRELTRRADEKLRYRAGLTGTRTPP
jgi:low affinity Fe/Cu permease